MRENLVKKDQKENLGFKEILEQMEKKVHLVKMVLVDLKDLLDPREKLVNLVWREMKVCPESVEMMHNKVVLEKLDLKDHLVKKEKMDILVHVENLEDQVNPPLKPFNDF